MMVIKRFLTSGSNGCSYHSLIIQGNNLFSFGRNKSGQLGIGYESENQSTPQKMDMTNVVSISCGENHSIILCRDGLVYAFGENQYGQLGIGNQTNQSKPQKICNISNVVSIACGSFQTLILGRDGYAYSFGYNTSGQLGIGNQTNQSKPQKIDIPNVVSISSGFLHSMILCKDGIAYSCGDNQFGQLGIGNQKKQSTPQKINIPNVVSISCGFFQTMILCKDGFAYSCGDNQYGQLGIGNQKNQTKPQKIDIPNVVSISCGCYHSLILCGNGFAFSFGDNQFGQLGIGNQSNQSKPQKINIPNVVSISCGNFHSMILCADGSLYSFGYNSYGQLGLGHTENVRRPNRIAYFTDKIKSFPCFVNNIDGWKLSNSEFETQQYSAQPNNQSNIIESINTRNVDLTETTKNASKIIDKKPINSNQLAAIKNELNPRKDHEKTITNDKHATNESILNNKLISTTKELTMSKNELVNTISKWITARDELTNTRKELQSTRDELISLKNQISLQEKQELKNTLPNPLILQTFNITPQNIHEIIKYAMIGIWEVNLSSKFVDLIEKLLPQKMNFARENDLNLNEEEIKSIMYYTIDARHQKIQGNQEQSPYKVLNSILSSRDQVGLEIWKQFLFHLVEGINKLPSKKQIAYRIWNIPLSLLSENYLVGNKVIWPTFTSTRTTNHLSYTENSGTCAILELEDGKDISPFSIYPDEDELLLLLPNSTFVVEEILGKHSKKLMNPPYPDNLDVMYLKQISPTISLFQPS